MSGFNEQAKGVYIIAATPFTQDGDIDFNSTDRLVDFYLEKGVTGMTLLGMMGESAKLTANESRALVQHVVKRVAGAVPIVVGVSSPGLVAMKELADEAMSAGCNGVMVAPTSTLRTDEQILRYFGQVADCLGPIPFVLQDFPLVTSVQIAPSVITKIVQTIPTCVMLKHEDWPGLAKISALRKASDAGDARRISILVGNGGLFLTEELERGADGAMTGFAYPEMMVDICKAHEAGDMSRARDLFDAYLPLMRYEQQPGAGLAVRKYVLARRGLLDSPRLRVPGDSLAPAAIAEIEILLQRQEKRLKEIDA